MAKSVSGIMGRERWGTTICRPDSSKMPCSLSTCQWTFCFHYHKTYMVITVIEYNAIMMTKTSFMTRLKQQHTDISLSNPPICTDRITTFILWNISQAAYIKSFKEGTYTTVGGTMGHGSIVGPLSCHVDRLTLPKLSQMLSPQWWMVGICWLNFWHWAICTPAILTHPLKSNMLKLLLSLWTFFIPCFSNDIMLNKCDL